MTQAEITATQSQPSLPPLVQRAVARLIRAFAPERVIVFGSWAKGTSTGKSDIDLLVIADLNGEPAALLRRARQLAGDCFPPVDVVIASPAEVTGAATARSPFLASILGSGMTIYRRAETSSQAESAAAAAGKPFAPNR
jgi:predicted nucleotidyltransferase